MQKLTVGSLFAGIGGLELGLERTGGFKTIWQVENDGYATRVLEKHWPDARRWGDIKEFNKWIESLATSLRVDSPAKTSATPGNAPALPEAVRDSGGKWCEPFAWYDQGTRSWRTWQRCWVEGWERFSGTWPRAGMTRNGVAYQRVPLVLISEVTACLSSPVVPRPVCCDGKGSGRIRLERLQGMNLRDWWNVNYRFVYPPVRVTEYLMGFPAEWTDLDASAMPLCPK